MLTYLREVSSQLYGCSKEKLINGTELEKGRINIADNAWKDQLMKRGMACEASFY
jgi:hypothetical protein